MRPRPANRYYRRPPRPRVAAYDAGDAEIIVQHAIKRYGDEARVAEALRGVLGEGAVQRTLDTLIGTQRVRRIGPDAIENNESHSDMPALPERLRAVVEALP